MFSRRESMRHFEELQDDDGLLVLPVDRTLLTMADRRLSYETATTVASAVSTAAFTSMEDRYQMESRLEECVAEFGNFSLVHVQRTVDHYALQVLCRRHLYTFEVPTVGCKQITATVLIYVKRGGENERFEELLQDYETSLQDHRTLSIQRVDDNIYLSSQIALSFLEYENSYDFQLLLSELVKTSSEYSKRLKLAQRRSKSVRSLPVLVQVS